MSAGSATDQKVATDQLRSAAQALAAIVTSSQDAVIAKNIDGIITSWNDGATIVYGWSAEAMVGRTFETIVPITALAEERERHIRIATGVAESGFRVTRLRADGQRIEVVMSMSPVFDDEGGVIGVASISRPVSSSEREVARFASLLEAAPDAIVCVDGRGTIVTVNAEVTKMFGYERAHLLGERIEVLLPEESRQRHVGLRSDYLRDPQVRAMGAGLALFGRRRDGSVFPIEVSLAPDHAQEDTIVIAVVRDMTEQRELEQVALENELRLRQLAENVGVVFLLRQIDPPDVLYVSPSARTVLGHEPSEWMHGKRALDIHPLDRDWVDREYTPVVIAGLAATAEFRVLLPDGATQWVRAISTPVLNPLGPPERSVVTIEDITDRVATAEALRTAEQAARAANDAKNHFLSRMSHELRTPLNAVLGFGQLLQMRVTEANDVDAVNQILKGGRHLLDLINDVLDIARIEAGETSTSIEAVSAADVIEEAIQLMATLAVDAGVTLLNSHQSTNYMVLADRQRLRQILLNLLSNAVKYNRRGGVVWVDTELHDGQVAITVHDDGPGIREELQSRLFTPFDRLGAEASGVDGAGIGLTLTRSLVTLMGGRLSVDSVAARGSAFTVMLPQAQAALSAPSLEDAKVAASPVGLPRAPRTLLYIEDNQPNVMVVEQLIKLRPEWRLIHAGLGGLGVELAQGHHPDLILLDLHLPDLSGATVLLKLKNDPATTNVPVVVVTADAATGQRRRLLDLGAAGYLTKPLDVAEILALLDTTSAGDPIEHDD